MAENPLLPDRELGALYRLLKAVQKLETASRRRTRTSSPPLATAAPDGRTALLAGCLLQISKGDVLLPQTGDPLAAQVLDAAGGHGSTPALPSELSQLSMAASMAAALKSTGTTGLVLAIASSKANDAAWKSALHWAQQQQLPLILVCADPSGDDALTSSSRGSGLTWTSVTQHAHSLGLPVLSVDGEDAVAVYRVMQESALRARSGGGPAVLWAVLPSTPRAGAPPRPAAATPLARLRRYLRVRGISLDA